MEEIGTENEDFKGKGKRIRLITGSIKYWIPLLMASSRIRQQMIFKLWHVCLLGEQIQTVYPENGCSKDSIKITI
jgi:hypothetical protein